MFNMNDIDYFNNEINLKYLKHFNNFFFKKHITFINFKRL